MVNWVIMSETIKTFSPPTPTADGPPKPSFRIPFYLTNLVSLTNRVTDYSHSPKNGPMDTLSLTSSWALSQELVSKEGCRLLFGMDRPESTSTLAGCCGSQAFNGCQWLSTAVHNFKLGEQVIKMAKLFELEFKFRNRLEIFLNVFFQKDDGIFTMEVWFVYVTYYSGPINFNL